MVVEVQGAVGIGLSGNDVNLARLPGWDEHSFGYHGDDGNMFPGRGQGHCSDQPLRKMCDLKCC